MSKKSGRLSSAPGYSIKETVETPIWANVLVKPDRAQAMLWHDPEEKKARVGSTRGGGRHAVDQPLVASP